MCMVAKIPSRATYLRALLEPKTKSRITNVFRIGKCGFMRDRCASALSVLILVEIVYLGENDT